MGLWVAKNGENYKTNLLFTFNKHLHFTRACLEFKASRRHNSRPNFKKLIKTH